MTINEMLIAAFAHQDAKRLKEAIALYNKILEIEPNHADASHELGLLRIEFKHRDIGLRLLKTAADTAPTNARFQINYAITLKRLGRAEEAIECLRRTVALLPGHSDALKLLGTTLRLANRPGEAARYFRQALESQPGDAVLHNYVSAALYDLGDLDEALVHCHRAIELSPDYKEAWCNLLMFVNYSERFTPDQIAEVHKDFGRHFTKQPVSAPQRTPSPDGRIRIGYLSADFYHHSVALFIWPVLAEHDRSRVRVTCYSDVLAPDVCTAQMKALAERWVRVDEMNDDQLAQAILRDENDILIDLSGHTERNRIQLLAKRKLAPIQATYLGYPNTTGLTTIDYFITDAIVDPPGMTESQYTEKLVRLPDASFVFIKPQDYPDVVATPAMQRGSITFGVFTKFAKIRPPMIDLWVRVLEAVPNARFILQSAAVNDSQTRGAFLRPFAERGMSDRVTLQDFTNLAEHLQMYQQVDIILDTFPFNGHTTTCQSLWMGVPVVTLAGQTHRSRMGASVLTSIGLPELIADSPDEYVRIASQLAGDVAHLEKLRSTLRERFANSVISDNVRFTRNLEDAYEQMLRGTT